MNQNIAIISIFTSLCLFLWHFIKQKEWKAFSFREIKTATKFGVVLLLPFLALFGLAKLGGLNASDNVLFFAVGVLVPSLLDRVVKSPWQRSLVLFAMCIGAYYTLPESPLGQIESLMGGVLTWKVATNLLAGANSQLHDLLPSFVWLAGLHWAFLNTSNMPAVQQTALLAGTISIALLLRQIQVPLLAQDRFFIKRIALSAIGGLGLLIIISKVIVVGHLDRMAIVAGVGFLCAYIMEAIDKNCSEPLTVSKPLTQLLLIGILTVAATRLFGTVGTLLLAATMVIATNSRTTRMAALFWGGRALVQAFVTLFDPNVTGINLNHAYTAAALFAGFLIMVMFALWIRDIQNKRWLNIIFLLVATSVPMASGYFLHPEPASSLLVSACVAGIIVSLFAPCLMQADLPSVDNLMLAPALMATFAHLSSELLTKGDEATGQERLMAIGALACLLVCVSLVQKVFHLPGPEEKNRTKELAANTMVPTDYSV